MATRLRSGDRKREVLRRQGVLNMHPERVRDPLFGHHDFFDPHDLMQVKDEMVRRVATDGVAVTAAADAFGFSRPSFYQAQASLEERGLAGLVPRKRGPHGGHKLKADVVAFLKQERTQDPAVSADELARRVGTRFGVVVHQRSVERALERQEKKRR